MFLAFAHAVVAADETIDGNLFVNGGSVAAGSGTNLSLLGGGSGATVVLGQGTNGNITLAPSGTGILTTAAAFRFQDTNNPNSSVGGWIWGQAGIGPTISGLNVAFNTGSTGAHAEAGRFTTTRNLLIGGSTDITGSGGLKIFGTTAASSTTSGALQVAGGIGVGGAGYFGGNMIASGSGSFRAGGSRPITIGTSDSTNGSGISFQGDSGGWAFGLHAKGSAGTDRGGFGFFGVADGLTSYYIGTSYSSPAMTLTPAGNVAVTGNLSVGGTFSAPGYTATSGSFTGGATGLTLNAGGSGNQNITLAPTGAGGAAIVDSASMVLRNDNSNPNGLLAQILMHREAYDPTGNAAAIQFYRGGNTSEGRIAFSTNPGTATGQQPLERMRITEFGDIGIGTTAPAVIPGMTRYLTLAATGADQASALELVGNRSGSDNPVGRISFIDDTAERGRIQLQLGAAGEVNDGSLVFSTANDGTLAPRMTILGDGKVGIGTAAPSESLTLLGGLLIDQNSGVSFNGEHSATIRITTTQGWARGYGVVNSANQSQVVFGGMGQGSNLEYAYIGPSYASPWLSLLPSGLVGIGTTTPSQKLHINDGGLRVDRVSAGVSAMFTGLGSSLWIRHDGGTQVRFQNTAGGDYRFTNQDNSADLVTIAGSGNVGVGTNAPTQKLQVVTTANKYGLLTSDGTVSTAIFNGTAGVAAGWLGTNSNHPLAFYTNSSGAQMILSTAGNLGVGTADPTSAKLVVAAPQSTATNTVVGEFTKTGGSNDFGSAILRLSRGVGGQSTDLELNSGGGGPFRYGTFADTLLINNQNATSGPFGSIHFVTNQAPRLTIGGGTLAGNIGIGTTTPAAMLDVAGTARITGQLTATAGAQIDGTTTLATASVTGTSNLGGTTTFGTAGSPVGTIDWGATPVASTRFFAGSGRFLLLGAGGTATNGLTIAPDGKVGVGTTNPGQQLAIWGGNGAPATSGSSADGVLRLGAAVTNLVLDGGVVGGSASYSWLQVRHQGDYAQNFNLSLNPNGGNVGIGTTSPSEKLEVSGNAKVSGNLSVTQAAMVTGTLTAQTVKATSGEVAGVGDAQGLTLRASTSGDGNVNIATAGAGTVVLGNAGRTTRSGSFLPLTGGGAYDLGGLTERWRYAYLSETLRAKNVVAENEVVSEGGTVKGAGNGLALKAGGTNKNVTVESDGTGTIALNNKVIVGGTATPATAPLTVKNTDGDQLAVYSPDNNAMAVQTLLDGQALASYGTYGGNGQNRLLLQPKVGNVGIGTEHPDHKLTVNGTIHATEVIVDNAVAPDYVFDAAYRNAPLSEVEAHIKAHKHLPGVPSARQLAANGMNVAQMQNALLQKVEELTLHLITQDKRMAEQDRRIERLEAENATLRSSAGGQQ